MEPTNCSIEESLAHSREEAQARLNLLCDNVTTELNHLTRDCRRLSRTLKKVTTITQTIVPSDELTASPIVETSAQTTLWHKEMNGHY